MIFHAKYFYDEEGTDLGKIFKIDQGTTGDNIIIYVVHIFILIDL